MTRKYLGRTSTVASRDTVFEDEDGLEIQSTDQYEVAQRRVLFADVTMITIHRERGTLYLVAMTFMTCFMLLPAAMGLAFGSRGVAVVFGLFALPFAILTILRATRGVDVVTVFGRRSKAVIRFAYRKKRARELYERLTATVAETQQRLTAEYAAEAVAAPRPDMPELPDEPRPILSNPYGGGSQ